MKKLAILTLPCLVLMFFASTSQEQTAQPGNATSCIECLRIRVGLPRVVRGPSGTAVDNTFSAVKLPNGRFRGFTAVGTSWAIDGNAPWDMGGPAVPVLKPGGPGTMSNCGQWLEHVEPVGKTLLGWVHRETCNGTGMDHWSMSIATSTDYGLTWHDLGFILTGSDSPTPGKRTGEGSCTAVNGGDGYYYAYCGRTKDSLVYAARAPVTNPGSGNWKKYFNGAWSEPGLGGDASRMGPKNWTVGTAAARWLTSGEFVNLGGVTGGLGVYFSTDHVNFIALPAPLIDIDPNVSWVKRLQEPHELLTYFSLLDANTGGNQLNDHWLLAYMDLQPHESFDKRYLVFRPVEVSRSRKPGEPQVAIALAHWYNPGKHEHWSTVAAVPGNYSDFKLQAVSGYLMTAADSKLPSVELEDCIMDQGQHLDHILMQKKEACATHGYRRDRTVGWVFASPQPDSQPLYRCYSEAEKSHFAANTPDCDHLGKQEALLGYNLKE